ncbi:MAG: alanine:cation symporter family protein, partial [Bacteroidia bacterium]|nr:alanine:cation symporter family protein [Bacteroidia bacterium]NNJ56546.1 sodium:alanine symporter family protein [Bacteroidia bacterium]
MKRLFGFGFFLMLSSILFAQADSELGLDERINNWFAPIADKWESIVLFPISIGDSFSIPFVVVLLVAGALFFTLYFSFINIRKFPLAINVVRGKHDDVDHHEVEKTNLNVVDGDLIGTIGDEGREGEVSHFQALATAVSGTVGLGNIAGVAVAIALGGPGATFWMVVCGLLGMSTKFVECTLGVKYRDVGEDGTIFGGPMYYLR